jgi:hypothetical protein
MNEKLPYWGSVFFSAAALLLLVVNISLANVNRATQADVAQRQNTIATGQQLAQLNQGLVQAMAEAALKNNNTHMRDLLATQGITLKNEPAPAAKPTEKK